MNFSDEAHFDPIEMVPEYVLRAEDTRCEPENIQEMPPLGGIALHVAASISWLHKGNYNSTTTKEKNYLSQYKSSLDYDGVLALKVRVHTKKLQEDGDPSHGLTGKGDNLAKRIGKANWIEVHKHPAQSSDLNPMKVFDCV